MGERYFVPKKNWSIVVEKNLLEEISLEEMKVKIVRVENVVFHFQIRSIHKIYAEVQVLKVYFEIKVENLVH